MTPDPHKTQHAWGGPLKSFAVGFCVFSLGSVLAAWLTFGVSMTLHSKPAEVNQRSQFLEWSLHRPARECGRSLSREELLWPCSPRVGVAKGGAPTDTTTLVHRPISSL